MCPWRNQANASDLSSDVNNGLRVQVPPGTLYARMVELADTVALEAIAEMRESSNLSMSIDNIICRI